MTLNVAQTQRKVDFSPKSVYIGRILSLVGEILIFVQGLIFFFLTGEITEDVITYAVLLPLPVFIVFELFIYLADRFNVRGMGGFFYFLFIVFASASWYLGGGWYFGMIYLIFGLFLRIYGRGGVKNE
jgi:hypothetical protein